MRADVEDCALPCQATLIMNGRAMAWGGNASLDDMKRFQTGACQTDSANPSTVRVSKDLPS